MNRRRYLAAVGALSTTLLAGCAADEDGNTSGTGDDEDGGDSGQSEPTAGGENTGTGEGSGDASTETESDDAEDTTDSSGGDGDLRIRVTAEGSWSGSIGTGGSSSSVEGEGDETLDVEDSADIVSATIQKDADDDSELTVELLRGDTVLQSSSTTSSYGVASVSSMSNAGGESGSGSDESNVQVRVSYEGDWSGSITAGGSGRSVEGSGEETLDISGSPSIVSANAQKQDDGSGELVIEILIDGEVVESSSTTAEYGVASVTAQV